MLQLKKYNLVNVRGDNTLFSLLQYNTKNDYFFEFNKVNKKDIQDYQYLALNESEIDLEYIRSIAQIKCIPILPPNYKQKPYKKWCDVTNPIAFISINSLLIDCNGLTGCITGANKTFDRMMQNKKIAKDFIIIPYSIGVDRHLKNISFFKVHILK